MQARSDQVPFILEEDNESGERCKRRDSRDHEPRQVEREWDVLGWPGVAEREEGQRSVGGVGDGETGLAIADEAEDKRDHGEYTDEAEAVLAERAG